MGLAWPVGFSTRSGLGFIIWAHLLYGPCFDSVVKSPGLDEMDNHEIEGNGRGRLTLRLSKNNFLPERGLEHMLTHTGVPSS